MSAPLQSQVWLLLRFQEHGLSGGGIERDGGLARKGVEERAEGISLRPVTHFHAKLFQV